MNSLRRLAALALGLGLCTTAPASSLPAGVSGAWYNPDQPGHGLSIEVLDADTAILFWYAFDRDGQPVHLYVEGEIHDGRIDGTAWLGRGMRFGEFDPARHQLLAWGEVDVEFDDCRQARLRYAGSGPAGEGFGSGEIALARLTSIATTPCDLALPERVPEGRFRGLGGSYRGADLPHFDPADGGLSGGALYAVIDRDGRFWGAVDAPVRDGSGIGFGGDSAVFTGVVSGVQRGGGALEVQWRQNAFLAFADASSAAAPVAFTVGLRGALAEGLVGTGSGRAGDRAASLRLHPDTVEGRYSGSLAALAGTWRFGSRSQFFDTEEALELTADGGLCLVDFRRGGCAMAGQLEDFGITPDGGRLWTFELARAGMPAFEGLAWSVQEPDGPRLVLAGFAGKAGLGIVARR